MCKKLPSRAAATCDSGRVVGHPYLTGLGKSCPSSYRNRAQLLILATWKVHTT
jgi:hypothetical protein